MDYSAHSMRWTLAVVALFVAACGLARPGPQARAVVEQELRSVDSLRIEALRAGDTAVLAQLYADDFVMITSVGQLRTKADQLRDVSSGAVQHQDWSERILKLALYGDVAVVQGESATGTLAMGGVPERHQRRYTRVYVRRSGKWQLVATHISVVADSANSR